MAGLSAYTTPISVFKTTFAKLHNTLLNKVRLLTQAWKLGFLNFGEKKIDQFQYLDLHYGEFTHVKRQATLALLAVPVIGNVLNSGYSWWEVHKLKDKIPQMQGTFYEFAHKIYDFEEHTVK